MSRTHSTIARAVSTAAAVVGIAGLASAQQVAAAGSALPPIRPLGKATATSAELLGAVSQVRGLPDGRVLVNDNLGRKVVLFDAALAKSTIIADTTSATANAYSSRAGGLIAYKGDSTLFVDPTSLAMLVIDGKGRVTRVMAVPRPNDAQSLIGGPNGTPAFDAQGRLVFRAPPHLHTEGSSFGGGRGGQFQIPTTPDSAAIVRIALDTRAVDTVAFIKVTKQGTTTTHNADGSRSVTTVINPMQVVDDWAVTSDGRVAIVRGREYRIEWIDGKGAVSGSNKIPFAWRPLDDAAKAAFIDSTKKAMEMLRRQAETLAQSGDAGAAAAFGGGSNPVTGVTGAAPGPRFDYHGPGGEDARRPTPASSNTAPTAASNRTEVQLTFVSPSELPDYAPPFAAGAVRSDVEGNIWVRTSNVVNGGSVYDIVNANGVLSERVLLPAGRVIAGFGRGMVYMGYRDGAGVRLEAAPIHAATP